MAPCTLSTWQGDVNSNGGGGRNGEGYEWRGSIGDVNRRWQRVVTAVVVVMTVAAANSNGHQQSWWPVARQNT